MNMKNKNFVIAAAIAIAVLIAIVIGTFVLGGDKETSSSEGSDIISSDHFQDAESGDTVTTAEKSLTVSTTEATATTVTTSTVETAPVETTTSAAAEDSYTQYYFRSSKLLNQHFEKHGGEFADDFGYTSAEEYEKGASDVINNSDSLYKVEAEDGDGVYYLEATNEFVILSTDGYIRTYFRPNGGISYFNRQ